MNFISSRWLTICLALLLSVCWSWSYLKSRERDIYERRCNTEVLTCVIRLVYLNGSPIFFKRLQLQIIYGSFIRTFLHFVVSRVWFPDHCQCGLRVEFPEMCKMYYSWQLAIFFVISDRCPSAFPSMSNVWELPGADVFAVWTKRVRIVLWPSLNLANSTVFTTVVGMNPPPSFTSTPFVHLSSSFSGPFFVDLSRTPSPHCP